MILRPPRSPRTDTLVPYTTLVRSAYPGHDRELLAQLLNDLFDIHVALAARLQPHEEQPGIGRQPAAGGADPRKQGVDVRIRTHDGGQFPLMPCHRFEGNVLGPLGIGRSEEHTSELQSLMRISS